MINHTDMNVEFMNCLEKIVHSHDCSEVKKAWDVLSTAPELGNPESGSKNYTYDFNRNYDKILRSILTEKKVRNVKEIPNLLSWFSKFLNANTSNPISDDIACFLVNSAEYFEKDPCLDEILMVMTNYQGKYLPLHNDHTNLCNAIVEVLSRMKIPNVYSGIKDRRVQKFYDKLENIRNFLKLCKSNKAEKNIAIICIGKMFEIMLESNRTEPSSALVIVLQVVDDELWTHMYILVKKLLEKCKDESEIVKMLCVFCQWLVQPAFIYVNYLSRWLTLFVKDLKRVKKYQLASDVAKVLPKIFSKCWQMDKFDEIDINDNIILELLLSILSADLYHEIVEQINIFLLDVIKDKTNLTPKKKQLIKHIIEKVDTLMKKFSEHLNLSCEYCDKFKKLASAFSDEVNQSYLYRSEESEKMDIAYPSTSTDHGRFNTGKVGLLNLGNTCYMNSVLQALVMTKEFCHEVLLYKSNDLSNQIVLKNLQNLFALLKYSTRSSLAPTEILQASRPAYFMPGHQQDSSEFLCYLLDVMYEQEKSVLMHNGNSEHSIKIKIEDREMVDAEEITGNSLLNDDGTSPNMSRWTTEENLSEGASLQRKTQSLADFTQGEELAQTRSALSDSHSDSTDSGIQSVGGEDSSSPSASSPSSPASLSYLVHRVFSGELKVIYRCIQCNTESHNTDRFWDLQLGFLDNNESVDSIRVQDLINLNYFHSEILTGDNKYRCEKCAKLCDAERIIKIVQAPAHLILTLKHFRYNSESGLRTKLRRRVIYDDILQVPVLNKANEMYQLYAAVVHSGYSMDYGHYMTYACDSKNRWYKFNDSYIIETTLEDFKKLEPPDTPYILFYKKFSEEYKEDTPEFSMLNKSLQLYVELDRRNHVEERRNSRFTTSSQIDDHKNTSLALLSNRYISSGTIKPSSNCDNDNIGFPRNFSSRDKSRPPTNFANTSQNSITRMGKTSHFDNDNKLLNNSDEDDD